MTFRFATVLTVLLCALAVIPAGVEAAPDKTAAEAEDNPRADMLRYELAIREDPDDMDARLGLALALIELGEYDRAEKMAELVLRRTGRLEARLAQADARLRMGRTDEAAELLNDVEGLGEDGKALAAVIEAERQLAAGAPKLAIDALAPAAAHPTYGGLARIIAARSFYVIGDLAAARRLTDEIIARGGDSVTALLFRAQLALRTGDTGAARRLAEGIDAIDPGNVAAGTIAVEALMREGRLDEARKRFAKIKPTSLDDPRPIYLEGLLLKAEGKTREADLKVAQIEKWLSQSSGGALFLASLKEELGFTAQAEAVLRERINVEPTDVTAVRTLVKLLDRTEQEVAADVALDRALEVMPDHPDLIRFKASRLAERGEFDAASQLIRRLGGDADEGAFWDGVEDDRDAALAARMMAALGNDDPASAVRLAASTPSQDPMVQNLLAAALIQQGEVEQARRILDRVMAGHPDFLAVVLNRAALEGGPTAVADMLDKAVELGARSARIHRQLAIERFVLGETGKALAAAKDAAAAEDASPEDHLLEGRIYLAEGRTEKARGALLAVTPADGAPKTELDRAGYLLLAGAEDAAGELAVGLAVPTDSPSSALRLAEILSDSGRKKDARELLARAYDLYPEHPAITEAWLLDLARDDLDAAQTELLKATGLSPEVRRALGVKLLMAAGKTGAARKAVAEAPGSAPLFAVARELASTDATREALLTRMAAYAAEHPRDLSVLPLLSGLAIQQGDLARAEKALAMALAAAPGNPGVLNNLALARAENAPEDALRLAAEAYRQVPADPAIAETYASLLVKVGQQAKAARVARRGLLTSPDAEELRIYAGAGKG